MRINDWLSSATSTLETAGVGTARLDALVLLEDELREDRAKLLAYPERILHSSSIQTLNDFLQRRSEHEPLAYIRGKTEFFGREFYIDSRVLEPRPESEAMIHFLKRLRLPISTKIADVGSGSGALGITAVLELPRTQADFYDIDPATLEVAEQNAKTHSIRSRYFMSDLLQRAPHAYDVILANLPYVPARYHINQAARHEPGVAIYGGGDGLALYRRLFGQLATHYVKPRYVITESLPFQHAGLQLIAESAGFRFHRHEDFIQVFETPS